jgi:hypothetical protein
MSVVVKITPNDRGNPSSKLADAELHFTGGELDGLKLVGFSVWKQRGSNSRTVSFPARQYPFRLASTRPMAKNDASHCSGPSQTPTHRRACAISYWTPTRSTSVTAVSEASS